MLLQNIPILRIFDVAKAKEFYIDWLGFTIEFEHQFEPGMPYYFGIKRDDIQLHLSDIYYLQPNRKILCRTAKPALQILSARA
jgi:catechol 2,3-dioxygenase-like lactoylglutathione lyase family enzyme